MTCSPTDGAQEPGVALGSIVQRQQGKTSEEIRKELAALNGRHAVAVEAIHQLKEISSTRIRERVQEKRAPMAVLDPGPNPLRRGLSYASLLGMGKGIFRLKKRAASARLLSIKGGVNMANFLRGFRRKDFEEVRGAIAHIDGVGSMMCLKCGTAWKAKMQRKSGKVAMQSWKCPDPECSTNSESLLSQR